MEIIVWNLKHVPSGVSSRFCFSILEYVVCSLWIFWTYSACMIQDRVILSYFGFHLSFCIYFCNSTQRLLALGPQLSYMAEWNIYSNQWLFLLATYMTCLPKFWHRSLAYCTTIISPSIWLLTLIFHSLEPWCDKIPKWKCFLTRACSEVNPL